MDVCAVGGDKVSNALWRSGEGRAVEALAAAGTATKTVVFILLGINDISARALGGKGLEMDMNTGSEKVVSDVVGGVCALARELKAGLRSEHTSVHILEVPLLEGMRAREAAENINATLRKLSAEAGFGMVGWGRELLSECGTIKAQWLISQGRNSIEFCMFEL